MKIWTRLLPIIPTLFVGCFLFIVSCSSNSDSQAESEYSEEEIEEMRRELLPEPDVNETVLLDTTFQAIGNYPAEWSITFEKEGGAATLVSDKFEKPYTFKTPGAVRGKGNSMILAGIADDGSRVEMRINASKCQNYKTLEVEHYAIRINVSQKNESDKILFMGCGSYAK